MRAERVAKVSCSRSATLSPLEDVKTLLVPRDGGAKNY